MDNRTQQPNNKRIKAVLDTFKRIGTSAHAKAFQIILLYFIIGCLWILLSDRTVGFVFKDPSSMVMASIAKGWLYVIVTSILFFALIYGALRKEIQAKERAENLNVDLQKSNILFSAILESSPEIIVFALDKQYHYIAFNNKLKEIVRELFGKTIEIGSSLLDIIENKENRESAKAIFDRAFSGESFVLEEYLDTKLANLYMQSYYSPIRSENEIIGLTCFSLNITPMKTVEEENKYLSFHDKLTGLYNRRSCEEAILKMDTILNYPISVIIGDVNGLKLVNDSFGQQTGNELLQQAADAIIRVCRPTDIVARWGGDEFIILLPKTDAQEAEDIISMAKQQCLQMQMKSLILDISFGHGTKFTAEEDMNTIIKNAEDSMFKQKIVESKSMRSQTLKTIIHTLHEKNPREEQHSKRVADICQKIGTAMGFSETQLKTIYMVGYLHDIGKIALEEGILNKPGKLTEEEFESVKQHPEIGCRIIRSAYETTEIADAILAHHEKWDGTGYPRGLKGEEIPLYSRIITIADSYDAMTSERTYKNVLSAQQAADEIRRCAGKQFDPVIAEIFINHVFSA
jgi:diguanylate cyclase (GGDEF) domain/uncharacterized domain HDIG